VDPGRNDLRDLRDLVTGSAYEKLATSIAIVVVKVPNGLTGERIEEPTNIVVSWGF
jgi:hypothetical protein